VATAARTALSPTAGEEIVLYLRGRLAFEFEGGEVVEIRPRDVIHFKGHLRHRWRNPGPETAGDPHGLLLRSIGR
jgi:quercetin dioxygenase-like cupin family protein